MLTAEEFARLIISDNVVNRIKEYRRRLPELERLKEETKSLELRPESRELKQEIKRLQGECRKITQIKSGLPVLMYQAATFDETTSKKGTKGRWRKQQAVRLNGLFMLDVDHIGTPLNPPEGGKDGVAVSNMELSPRELFQKWVKEWSAQTASETVSSERAGTGPAPTVAEQCARWAEAHGIVLVHVTPSGRGLRIVAIADPEVGNIADNQAALAKKLGVEPDVACKDASRCSFCPGFEDILYINNEQLFTYENKAYDEKFGPQYRRGDSRATGLSPDPSLKGRGVDSRLSPDPSLKGRGVGSPEAGNAAGEAPAANKSIYSPPSKGGAGGESGGGGAGGESYHNVPYSSICAAWFRRDGGKPKAGDRHQTLYRMACDLRYVTDFDPRVLARVLKECEVGADVAAERGEAELDRIASDACALQRYRAIPRRMQEVLQSAGVQLSADGQEHAVEKAAAVDYGAWWARLKPLLDESPGLQEAVVTLPDHLKLAGVLAAGAMLGTYLTRCWWTHFDGKEYRLSFLVYIIGGAASGKSFVTDMDRLIMAPMLASDQVGREWERQYKEDMKKRSASSKDAKAAAPDQQHPCIRYVPSTISNAMLYRRLTDAIDQDNETPDGLKPLHLHIYTMEPELATALRAQQGSWAGKNDLELKSFHNEYAGVDYANDQSVNGIIQVNWNQVVTGTPESMGRKIKPSMVLDGLVTRLILFPMPPNDFQMIERREPVRQYERACLLRTLGIKLEQMKGELKAGRLVDFCYDYEKRLTDEARLEQDYCLDYFRKRIPVIMMRYTLVRMVLRALFGDAGSAPQPPDSGGLCLTVEDSDLEFARLIGDWCLFAQMHMFGEMVMEAQERERSLFTPRRRSSKVREAYAQLPKELTTEMLVEAGLCANVNVAGLTLRRWADDGLVVKEGKKYKKKYDVIPE